MQTTTTSTDARPPKGPQQNKSPADELQTLKEAVDDLQGKRLTALQLYQEEKAKRQSESNRAEELAAQLHALKQSMKLDQGQKLETTSDASSTQNDSADSVNGAVSMSDSSDKEIEKSKSCSSVDQKWGVVHTSAFTADVRQFGRLPPSTPNSLTWFSRSMGDVMPQSSDFCAILWPLDEEIDEKIPMHNDREQHKSQNYTENSSTVETPSEVLQLQEKLKQAEQECVETHEELMESQRLIADLKEQLEETTRACKELIKTIHDQEETIGHYST